jgi:anti-sigma factor RsiW
MPNPHHPDDERLSALAARDDDALADDALRAHTAHCDRCADLVAELGALRASLADLPDLLPARPLQLIPAVPDPTPPAADRLGGWVRRLFAPMVTAGAALALVGLVGTASPATQPMFGGADAQVDMSEADGAGAESVDTLGADEWAAEEGEAPGEQRADDSDGAGRSEIASTQDLPAERSPWPMVLFTGVAVVIGALMLRWILAPRVG